MSESHPVVMVTGLRSLDTNSFVVTSHIGVVIMESIKSEFVNNTPPDGSTSLVITEFSLCVMSDTG